MHVLAAEEAVNHERHIEELHQDGFTVIRGFWPDDLLAQWEMAVQAAYCTQVHRAGGDARDIYEALHWIEEKDKRAGYEVLTMLELSVHARRLLASNALLELTDILFGLAMTFSVGPHPFVNMPASKRLLYRWHSESCYYPKRRHFYNFWMPIFGPKHEGNGTMWMAKGSHLPYDEWHFVEYQGYDDETYGKRQHFVQYEIPANLLTEFELVPIIAAPGDLVVFDRLMAHASSQNESNEPSMASVFRVFDYSHDMTLAGDPAVKPFSGRDHGRPGMRVAR